MFILVIFDGPKIKINCINRGTKAHDLLCPLWFFVFIVFPVFDFDS
jgi:hypothetical protein